MYVIVRRKRTWRQLSHRYVRVLRFQRRRTFWRHRRTERPRSVFDLARPRISGDNSQKREKENWGFGSAVVAEKRSHRHGVSLLQVGAGETSREKFTNSWSLVSHIIWRNDWCCLTYRPGELIYWDERLDLSLFKSPLSP